MNSVFGPSLDVHISITPTAKMRKVLTQYNETSQHTVKFWVGFFSFPFFPFFIVLFHRSTYNCPHLSIGTTAVDGSWIQYRPVRCRIHFLNFCQIQLINQFPPVILGMQPEEKQVGYMKAKERPLLSDLENLHLWIYVDVEAADGGQFCGLNCWHRGWNCAVFHCIYWSIAKNRELWRLWSQVSASDLIELWKL